MKMFLLFVLALPSFALLAMEENSADLTITKDEVIVTCEKSDVCGLNYLGEVKVTEKRWFYHNSSLKEQTMTELKKLTSEKGGNIVFVDIKEKKGFGIFFSTTIVGYVYEK
jgi:hypothetical protein